jgi:NitT/TauT family transport system ATP-binding protein
VRKERLAVHGLTKDYPARDGGDPLRALDGVDLAVADQELVCLLGPSGCGKSTLLNVVAGLDRDYRGEILVDGAPRARGRAPRIGYLFQEPRLLPWLTVERNVEFVLRSCAVPHERWEELQARYLDMTGLSAFRRYHPHELSGGMRQRLALARALAVEPEILLMDEPFSGLDEMTARRMRLDLLAIRESTRKTIVFVTHNAYEATFLADRIVLMTPRPGRVDGEIAVEIPRPRDYDDPAVFELNRAVVRRYLEVAGDLPAWRGQEAPSKPPHSPGV